MNVLERETLWWSFLMAAFQEALGTWLRWPLGLPGMSCRQ